MKQTKGFQIWQIIYPVGLYYVVSSLCYFALEILLGSADETYMLRQLVGDAVTIPVILKFYMADQNIRDTVYGKKKFRFSSEQAINIAVTVVSVAALGIAVNNIIRHQKGSRLQIRHFLQAQQSMSSLDPVF